MSFTDDILQHMEKKMTEFSVSRACVRAIYDKGEAWSRSLLRGLPFALAKPNDAGGASARLYRLSDVVGRLRSKPGKTDEKRILQLIEAVKYAE